MITDDGVKKFNNKILANLQSLQAFTLACYGFDSLEFLCWIIKTLISSES